MHGEWHYFDRDRPGLLAVEERNGRFARWGFASSSLVEGAP
jgi:hypothetical protein